MYRGVKEKEIKNEKIAETLASVTANYSRHLTLRNSSSRKDLRLPVSARASANHGGVRPDCPKELNASV